MIKAGITGGTGYAAGELLRLLLHHPQTEIKFIYSHSRAGDDVTDVHTDLIGDLNLTFTGEISGDIDVLFLCMGHGHAREFLEKHSVPDSVKIIDLSRDFRLIGDTSFRDRNFVYGLPELQKKAIRQSNNIANPGCFATAIQLALLPIFSQNWAESELHVHGITGSTGAGKSLRETTHFSWRTANVSIYKALDHQHVDEILQSLQKLAPSLDQDLNFIPVRGNFTRGIFISAYTYCDRPLHEIQQQYQEFYAGHPFTIISDKPIDLKQVVNTNKCLLHITKEGDKLLVTSIIDNLLKGAAGQAVQNMNLIFDLDEQSGLRLKSTQF